MGISKQSIDDLRNRSKISDFILSSTTGKLRGNKGMALCPFHGEKTASMSFTDEDNLFHCFGCKEGGDIYKYIQLINNVEFQESVEIAAEKYGFNLTYTDSKFESDQKNLIGSMSKIHNFFINNMKEGKSSESIDYLKSRDLDGTDIKEFRIGYAEKDEKSTNEFFKKNNLTKTDLKNLGLLSERGNFLFKNRIIFPINNLSGNVIGFGGRIIDDNKNLAKYINSPETLFFKKGLNLYNLDKARKLSNKLEDIFLVEGYMDVIGLSKNGIENTVANLGTALTSRQIQILNQFYNHIIICFDGDQSGYKAALRAAENIIDELKPDKKISFLLLENNLDPDNYVNKFGKEKFLEFSEQKSIPIHKFIFEHYKVQTTESPTSKAIFEKKLREIASNIKDGFVKKYTLEYFLEKVSELTPNINSKIRKNYIKSPKSLAKTKSYYNETKSLKSFEIKEFSFLYTLLAKPKLIYENLHLIYNVKLYSDENKQLFAEILNQSDNLLNLDVQKLNVDKNLINRVMNYASVKHIISKNLNNDESLSLDIEADYQFLDGDIVYSEGNVILYLDNAKLNADKVSFDKEKKIFEYKNSWLKIQEKTTC